jgi:hypothetical protein
MFYSEKFRDAIYWQYGMPCAYRLTKKVNGDIFRCSHCTGESFIQIPWEYKMQCIHCWSVFPELANHYKYDKERTHEAVVFPEFDKHYSGILKAVMDFKRYGKDGFIRIYQYSRHVEFVSESVKDCSTRYADADTSKLSVSNFSIRECIKEAWDWENGMEAGMDRPMYDFIAVSDTPRIFFTGPKKRTEGEVNDEIYKEI